MHTNVECVCFLFCGFDYHQETVKNYKKHIYFISKMPKITSIFSILVLIYVTCSIYTCVRDGMCIKYGVCIVTSTSFLKCQQKLIDLHFKCRFSDI